MRNTSSALKKGLLQLSLLAGAVLPLAVQAQTQPVCSATVKDYVLAAMLANEKLPEAAQDAANAKLYEQFKYCANDAAALPTFVNAARQCGAAVGYHGSLFFEEMSCCGYDPQRRTFACPVKVKQPFGFGGSPNPGSREYVLNCVFDPATNAYQPVAEDSVHLANSVAAPTWQFAVLAQANRNLPLVQPMDQSPQRARSILSWGMRPTSCNYQPIWGNWLDYSIRLDQ